MLDIDEFSLIENFATIYKAGDCSLFELNEIVKNVKMEKFQEYFLL